MQPHTSLLHTPSLPINPLSPIYPHCYNVPIGWPPLF
jgi:hypothetical protein